MKKISLSSVLLLLLYLTISGQDQKKNIFGVSAGIVPGIMDMYFDDPFNNWYNREASPVCQLFYARQVAESFRIGSYFEYEKANFSFGSENAIYNFSRFNFGLNWIGRYPKTALHLQLGGYAGFGIIKTRNWDNLSGFDIGMIAGPAFEKNNFGIALHLHGGHGWYESTGTPSGVMLYTPKILLKVYVKI
jgi:hypothetical protein